jgi:hypothetical protein
VPVQKGADGGGEDGSSGPTSGPPMRRRGGNLKAIRAELGEVSPSAMVGLGEGFEEALALHRLGVFALVGRSLEATHVIESLLSWLRSGAAGWTARRPPARSTDGSPSPG